MRVYEISKQLSTSNKEVLDLLRQAGFNFPSHMSILSPEALEFLAKHSSKIVRDKERIEKNDNQDITINTGPNLIDDNKPLQKKAKELVSNNAAELNAKASLSTSTDDKDGDFVSLASVENSAPKEEKKNVLSGGEISNSPITVVDFAQKAKKPVSEIIIALLKKGIACAKNQLLASDTLQDLARDYGLKIVEVAKEVSNDKKVAIGGAGQDRDPVVVIIGHVDHGKTTLLDYVRKTRVAAKEKGGITQHLGAYEVTTPQGNIVFLDTPGHEAFSKMRSRGVRVADIAILVVAADDGVKPQTIEAIKHAQSVNVPIVVALNKIDKASAPQIEAAKRGLSQYGLVPEEWGGSTIIIPVSAKNGTGIDRLLEMIILQAQLMELCASSGGPGRGFVLEAKIEKGFGPVATVIGQEGLVKIGDYFVAGSVAGKVNVLINSAGKRLKEVGPSVPVRIAGFDSLPNPGDFFEVVSQVEHKKSRSQDKERVVTASEQVFNADDKVLAVILKTDNNSSKEALVGAIQKLTKKNMRPLRLIHSGVGDISESDVGLGISTGAIIYGFHVKVDPNAARYAQQTGINIHLYQVIYQLLDDLSAKATKAPQVVYAATKIGEAVVLCTFKIKNIGVIAGAQVKEGRLAREGKLIVRRGRQKVAEGALKSLERERRSVKEVHAGFECAFAIEGFEDWQVDDRVECILNVASVPEDKD